MNQRQQTRQDATTREIPLHGVKAAGRVALVDDADYELVAAYRWMVWEVPEKNGGPYALAKITPGRKGIKRYMHQLLTGNPLTDHENHNGLDNRRANLRAASRGDNLRNQRPLRGGSSPYKGVTRRRDTGRWQAQIKLAGRNVRLGCYETDLDAALAYDVAARHYFGEFACPNFPEGIAAMVEFYMNGPHTPDTTRKAGTLLAEAVRYLNHATQPVNGQPGLKHPADANSLIYDAYTALERMEQLCVQLAVYVESAAAIPGRLYDARGGDAAAVVADAAAALREAAGLLGQPARELRDAHTATARLGMNVEDPDE